jgi:glycogen debranching enzyme
MILTLFKKKALRKKILKELLQLKDKRGFLKAGFPFYNRLFGRDAIISVWQILPEKPEIAKATLEILSQYQGRVVNKEREEEPGKILHETDFKLNSHPEGYFLFPYYGSVDSTLLYLILFSFYYKATKDKKFLDLRWENILKAVHWIKEYGDKDKDLFVEYQRKNEKGLFHQGWKDSFENHLKIEPPVALVEVQGYQYLALKEVAFLAQEKKDWDLADELEERAWNLKKKFNEKFWMEDKKYFALALDGKKQQRKAITSNPGHLLFTGIIREKEKIEFVVKRLFEKDMFTPYGIRTHSVLEEDFDPKSYHLGSVWPHDNWIIAQGLKKLGYQKEYQKIKNAIFKAYKKLGYLPEYYGVIDGKIVVDLPKKPCYPQAWSLGALADFLR